MNDTPELEPSSYLGDIAQWLTRTISLLVEANGRDEAEEEILAACEIVGESVEVNTLDDLSRSVRILDGLLIPLVSQTEHVEDLYDTAVGLLIHAKHNGHEEVLKPLLEDVEFPGDEVALNADDYVLVRLVDGDWVVSGLDEARIMRQEDWARSVLSSEVIEASVALSDLAVKEIAS